MVNHVNVQNFSELCIYRNIDAMVITYECSIIYIFLVKPFFFNVCFKSCLYDKSNVFLWSLELKFPNTSIHFFKFNTIVHFVLMRLGPD